MRAAAQHSLLWSMVATACPKDWVGGNGYFTAGAHRTVHGGLHDLLSVVKDRLSADAVERIDMTPYTREDFVADIMRLGNGKSDPALVDALVDNSRDAVEWLAKHVGIPFTFSFNRQAYEVNGRQKFWGGMVLSVEDGGKGLIAAHQRKLHQAGVDVWFDTPALSLVTEGDRVCGVLVRKDGQEVELEAGAVVLAAGGFEASADLRAKHLGAGWERARVRGTPYNTGDGFAIAKAVGAKLTGDWEGCHSTAWDANAAADAGERGLTNQFTKSGYPLGIMVNANGERFVDEGEDYRNYTYAKFGRAILLQPKGFAFQIWDSQVIAHLRKEEYGDGIVEKVFADSMGALADKLAGKGLADKEKLLETLKDFNEAVRRHREEHRELLWDPATKDGLSTQSINARLALPKSNWALTLDKAPFMAVKVACGITFTFGGLAIDPQSAAVVAEGGHVIEGLFCTGEMVGGLFVNNYPGGSGLTAGIVHKAVAAHHEPYTSTQADSNQPDKASDTGGEDIVQQNAQEQEPLRSPATHFQSPPDTPSMRTGPPRSLSFAYSLPASPPRSRGNSNHENADLSVPDDASEFPFSTPAEFRSALEYGSEQLDRKGKRRESRHGDESWNPRKWFQESPKEEKAGFDLGTDNEDHQHDAISTPETHSPKFPNFRHPKSMSVDEGPSGAAAPRSAIRRAFSVSHISHEGKPGNARWSRLRSLLPNIINHDRDPTTPGHSSVASNKVNITDELITGGLSTLMLRLWFERDEKNHRRIPVLFHRLRIRVSDSLHPMHRSKSIFRIECEYANGAARWVVYRQLRDFLSLHTHYTVSNVYNRNVDKMPEFPRTSLPYFKFLKREGRDVGQADFARLQRESLENYLINLIRAVMFHPSTNRLAGFLEISALSISLAQSGGSQYKAGYLHIEAKGPGGFGRKSVGWRAKKEARWCAVRESYIVVMEEPGELHVWDVFLLDSDFRIERPKRYYRQGLNLLHVDGTHTGSLQPGKAMDRLQEPEHPDTDRRSVIGSIRSRVSRIFHIHGHRRPATFNGTQVGHESFNSSSTSVASQTPAAMLDPSTNVNPIIAEGDHDGQADGHNRADDVSKHTFYVINAQMRLKFFARNERQMLQWITALEKVAATSHYTGRNRFDSFAPIRLNVAAQWLVDGRDYFWNLSRAILLACESIYIHDWWLSPELQMRRPNKDRYRLDRLLERKAKEGVKIYIILYYAKQRLMSLHPNVVVQRSPSHFQTGTFYWAHHEKMCVIDQAIAFMGGLDLCFGRWDTPQHVLVDDTEGTEQPEIWPGKDYSNPRLSDFYDLNKPEEDMYDRTKVPRMPWHDVAMQVVGQPARDLARHFVQRWNYLLRIKNHSRVMPFLLPPPEFRPGELHQMGLTGTCELQICRSAGPWSMGTPGRIEHSIQNAYLKAIQMSEHFVYIENQFFITSTIVNDVKIENNIGDALVHRIVRAHRDGARWKCCIVIPLLPGFTFPVDHSDASAIRIILECQNRTISRGSNSIFARLRKEGIDPDEYISVFSLRNWAKMRGDVLTTEQVYIHGKVCIVDDRLAIIGSANINERSQRGDRDSELAAVIRDTDMIDCTMAGKPFKVGRFAHTLRVRLMREHLGVNVDVMDEEDLMAREPAQPDFTEKAWDPDAEQAYGKEEGVTHIKKSKQRTPVGALFQDTLDGVSQAVHATGETAYESTVKGVHGMGLGDNYTTPGDDVLAAERKTYTSEGKEVPGFTNAMVPTLEEMTVAEHRPPPEQTIETHNLQDQVIKEDPECESLLDLDQHGAVKENGDALQLRTDDGALCGASADATKLPQTDDEPPHARSGVNEAEEERVAPEARTSIRKSLSSKAWTLPTLRPKVDPDGFDDPISDVFWKNVWVASAVHNTEIYRKVFHAIPDDLITTWKQYKDFILHHERLNKRPSDSLTPEAVARVPSEAGDEGALPDEKDESREIGSDEDIRPSKDGIEDATTSTPNFSTANLEKEPKPRKYAKGTEPFEKWERDEMEKLLGQINGHLVIFPTRFLEGEDIANNFLFNADRLLPLPIYN
ncbi:hypothetical protein D9615_003003 [Tricholomella constricta]|uniref:Phospholipase D1 n=1 Tax=Tricholomella constricta TaxID=117010 RepID=A0A8H5HFI8_9AGAR|nr:hypothetical protein D9615_003003 [Tricholomella constricta]